MRAPRVQPRLFDRAVRVDGTRRVTEGSRYHQRGTPADAPVWAALHARPDPAVAPLVPQPFDGSRPLRVGYICSRCEAAATRFTLLPVLKRHSPRRVRPYLYVSGPLQMDETWLELYEPYAALVREVHSLTDREFVDLTRADEIDILIELNGPAGTERYAAMASRCAPVHAARGREILGLVPVR